MAKVAVLNWDKKKVGDVDLPAEIFEQPVRKDILHAVVRWQLASRRQGTHQTKTKGLVRGGGKKPFKQKGTGQARQGSSRSPLMPGGGTAFGPQPRDYSYTLPRQTRKAGLRTALSYLLKEGRLVVVEDMASKEGKTKELASRLKGLGVAKSVLVDSAEDKVFKRAARNLASYRYLAADGLNVFDLLKYDHAVVTRASVEKIAERCR
ncbi:MAG TPA: 50S ribosomal protein L4 [Bdellovibrionales bacterium]|nr:50S ribosomal protein L4 [Bdellovibrionales bacterium]